MVVDQSQGDGGVKMLPPAPERNPAEYWLSSNDLLCTLLALFRGQACVATSVIQDK